MTALPTISTVAIPSARQPGVGVGTSFGTFGELLQGVLPTGGEGTDFLVTLPITRGSTAVFRPLPNSLDIDVWPVSKTKSRRLAVAMIARHGVCGGHLSIDCELPEGKGEASSSADMVATARAIADAFGIAIAPSDIEDLLREIEPSDGVMYPGVVAFDHRAVRLRAVLGTLPPAVIVGIDEGGQVDTVQFNKLPKPFSAVEKDRYRRLLSTLTAAVARSDLRQVGEVATQSSLMNQKLRQKDTLPEMLSICRRYGGLGVVTAHSGTTLGILLAAEEPDAASRIARIRNACSTLSDTVLVEEVLCFEDSYRPRSPYPKRNHSNGTARS